jgi:hypothetical protein
MKIVTVANDNYILNVVNLFKSYETFSFNEEKILYYFNVKKEKLNFLKENVSNLNVIEIPKVNDYIYNTKIFLFKAYALKEEINKGSSFIYSDSANCFVQKDNFLGGYIENNKRLLLQYPEEIKKNKFFTTKKCLQLLDCDNDYYKNKQQYWAGLQAYVNNQENIDLLNKQYEYMLVKQVAYPESTIERPDGSQNECWFHRNEQSVLSLLIEKMKLTQNFDYETFNMYGDFYTVFEHDINYKNNFDFNKITIHARDSKKNGFRFITKDVGNKYERL